MSSRGVVKGRGYSWVHQKDGARAFMVADDLGTNVGQSTIFSESEDTSGIAEVHCDCDETCAG